MGKASRKKALRRMGVGDYKLSEALVELVAPLLHDDMDLQERQSLFMVATIAWNIALFPREQRGRQILNFVGGLPEMPSQLEEEITRMLDGQPASPALPPEKLEFMELLISLMARKQERFPHDRRLVGDVELREQDGQYHLKVASRLAPEDFGADPA